MNNIYVLKRDEIYRPLFSEQQIELITDLYLNKKMSLTQIGKRFNIHYVTLSKYMKSWGIPISIRKDNFDEHYFDCIDTQNKAYILGFLYADGNNNYSAGQIRMVLQQSDKQILEKIRIELKSSNELKFIDYSKRKPYYNNGKLVHQHNQYGLYLCSKYLCNKLNSIGMVPNKSNVLEYPQIPDCFQKDFIRGYMDGDGSIMATNEKGRKTPTKKVSFVGTKQFLESMRFNINKELNIGFGKVYSNSKTNNVTCLYTIGGQNQTKIFLDWIYEGAELFLKRKHDKYIELYY